MSGPRARDVRLIIAAAAISMLLSAVCCAMAVMNLTGAVSAAGSAAPAEDAAVAVCRAEYGGGALTIAVEAV